MSTATREQTSIQQDIFIYQEMMTHPALFTHPHAQKIALLGCDNGMLNEVLKHHRLQEIWNVAGENATESQDSRVKFQGNETQWLKQATPESFDIIISNKALTEPDFLKTCFQLLTPEGLLMSVSTTPFQSAPLKILTDHLHQIGFRDVQVMHFPESSAPSGWRLAWMATRRGVFKRISEKEIFNKTFKTRYYNFDIHKAALAMPEFMREELNILS